MNWEALGAIGEILGASGVLVTLIYLAFQVRQAATVSWSQKTYTQAAYVQQMMMMQKSPEVLDAIAKCFYTREPLVVREMVLLESYLVSILNDVGAEYLHYQKGLVTKEAWELRRATIPAWFGAEPARFWWTLNKGAFTPGLFRFTSAMRSA